MTLRQLLSPQARAALFDPPTEVRAIVRHYTFSIEDVALIRQRRRNANRLGFAVHLAYLRFPGRVLGPNETPPAHLLAFIADQLRINPKSFEDYAQRDETRREHLAELQAYLGMRPFSREDYRTMARIAFNESIGTDRGDAMRRRHAGPSAAPVYSPPFGCGARKDRSGRTGARSKGGL